MVNPADISGRFALDTQSVDKLKLLSRQDQGKALKTVAQQFESMFLNMMLKSMREAVPQDGLFDSDQTRFYTEMHDKQLTQKLSSGKGIGLADMLVKQLSRSQALDGQAEKIAADGQAAAVPLSRSAPTVPLRQAPPAIDTGREMGKQRKDFVEKIWLHAASAAQEIGVSPHFLVGQAALESAWGKSEIRGADGKQTYNVFGIKASAGWQGAVAEVPTTEYVGGVAQKTTARFRAYSSYAEAFRDYADTLRGNPRYASVLDAHDASGFATALQRSGYATDPQYANKLSRILGSSAMREALAS
ncbi:MAG: flagellar assembly peptidoglycan hydrolase FlgJ [Sulfuricella sp.]|nr:flagellar assembly peptidoglycan hydrolase FlgJ [Sulfuricella sp.]